MPGVVLVGEHGAERSQRRGLIHAHPHARHTPHQPLKYALYGAKRVLYYLH